MRASPGFELPDRFSADLADFAVHPALLDVALSVAPDGEGTWLPFRYEHVQLHAPLPRRFWSHLRRTSRGERASTYDANLIGDDGGLLMTIEGYTIVRREDAPAENRTLTVSSAGDLDRLRFTPFPRRAPGPGEVEIEVCAAALNFRDVLKALGTMPAVAGSFGDECAGAVTRVGNGVDHVRPGDEVIATAAGALSRYVIAPARHAQPKPAFLPFEEAASLPVALHDRPPRARDAGAARRRRADSDSCRGGWRRPGGRPARAADRRRGVRDRRQSRETRLP